MERRGFYVGGEEGTESHKGGRALDWLDVFYDPASYRHLVGRRVRVRRGTPLAGQRGTLQRSITVQVDSLEPGHPPLRGGDGVPVLVYWRGSGGRRRAVAAFDVEPAD